MTIASAGVTFQMFNAAFLNEPVASQDGTGEYASHPLAITFARASLAWAFWFCDDWLEGKLRRKLTSICQGAGLRLSSEMPGMIAMPPFREPKRPLPRLDFHKVESTPAMEDFRAVGSVVSMCRSPGSPKSSMCPEAISLATWLTSMVNRLRHPPAYTGWRAGSL